MTTSETFLIASSNDATLRTVEAALREDKIAAMLAHDGLEALDLALDRAPRAIFLSANLLKVDGIEVARALRALDPTEHVPIIFLAENESEAKQIAQEELPFAEYLIAPFDAHAVKTHAANALHNTTRIADLHQHENSAALYAINDPLTHVFQRRYAVNRLAYESSRSVRYKNPLSVMLVDVDNLNEINREHGIVVGDAVLVEIAQLLHRLARKTDVIGRYNQQDFLIVLAETGEEGALKSANRIGKAVAEHKFMKGKLDLQVTVSIGVAGAAGTHLAENLALIGRAATALDQAKRAGKNRVEKG